jgi:hypothetical protein
MTGYMQANILGRDRGLKFGALAAEAITLDLVKLAADTGGNYSPAMFSIVIYWALYNNAVVKRVELDVSFEQVSDWVDDNWRNKELEPLFKQIAECYEKSKHTQAVIDDLREKLDEVTTTEEKKNMISQQALGGSI